MPRTSGSFAFLFERHQVNKDGRVIHLSSKSTLKFVSVTLNVNNLYSRYMKKALETKGLVNKEK